MDLCEDGDSGVAHGVLAPLAMALFHDGDAAGEDAASLGAHACGEAGACGLRLGRQEAGAASGAYGANEAASGDAASPGARTCGEAGACRLGRQETGAVSGAYVANEAASGDAGRPRSAPCAAPGRAPRAFCAARRCSSSSRCFWTSSSRTATWSCLCYLCCGSCLFVCFCCLCCLLLVIVVCFVAFVLDGRLEVFSLEAAALGAARKGGCQRPLALVAMADTCQD